MNNSELMFYKAEKIQSIQWDYYQEGNAIQSFFSAFMEDTQQSIANVQTEIGFVTIADVIIPYTVSNESYASSYVVSPYNHYITYAKEELAMLKKPLLEKILGSILNGIGAFTRKIDINRVVYLNNWLISTNLFSLLSKGQIEKITKAFIEKYPRHMIGFRSINDGLYKEMKENLLKNDYVLLPSRYVYISTPDVMKNATKRMRKIIKQDAALLKRKEIEVIRHEEFTQEEIDQSKLLYDQLYLEKYSYQNPQFTTQYIRHMHKEKGLRFAGIRVNGELEGVFGSVIYQGTMTNPLFGYNTSLPKEVGMYRMLRSLALQRSINNEFYYHQSAGVGEFKAKRGAKGYPEYTAIYTKHLSKTKQLFWKMLSKLLNKIAIPLIIKYKL